MNVHIKHERMNVELDCSEVTEFANWLHGANEVLKELEVMARRMESINESLGHIRAIKQTDVSELSRSLAELTARELMEQLEKPTS